MTPTGNLSLVQVGEGPRRWMKNENINKSNDKNTAAKEDATDSTDSMRKLISIPITSMAEKEDDTESTATVTTAAADLFSASEWDDDIIATVENCVTWNEKNYVFEKRRWVKPDRKWRTPTSRANDSKENTLSLTQKLMHNQRKSMESSCLAAQQGK